MKQPTFAILLLTTLICVVGSSTQAQSSNNVPHRRQDVLSLAEKVADYQLATLAAGYVPPNASPDSRDSTGWVQAAFYVGLTALADRSDKPSYDAAITARGLANQWQLGPRLYHADDHAIGAAYLWAARNGAGRAAIEPLQQSFERILAYPPKVDLHHADYTDPRGVTCDKRWCWSDALFMAPPVWLELGRDAANTRYSEYAKAEFEAATDFLYDREEHLYFRDSRFFDRRGPDGEKVFWSRGNGWAFSGLARMVPLLPANDPVRQRMESVFKQMAAKLKSIQKPHGYWAPSLLATSSSTLPESSGTGFFVHGIAWGIRAGLLPREEYEPVIRKGWAALTRAVHANGKLGFVQPVSDRPDNVGFDDTQFYGVGAFLLAATAVSDLDLRSGPDQTTQEPLVQAVLNVREGGTLTNGSLQGGTFKPKRSFTVPSSHFIHDGLFTFEGLGWESDLAAYRLYLDERFAIDIFGKKTGSRVLHTIGQDGHDYHQLAPWGMDVLKVAETVGLGGIGLLRDGKAGQLKPSTISVRIIETGPFQASTEVVADGVAGNAQLTARFSIRQGSATTRVEGRTSKPVRDLITGLVKHPGTRVLYSSKPRNGWAYVATWGRQSLANDDLGLVLFYRPADVQGEPGEDGSMVHVQFADSTRINYAFASAWEQDRQAVTDLSSFETWLNARLNELAAQL